MGDKMNCNKTDLAWIIRDATECSGKQAAEAAEELLQYMRLCLMEGGAVRLNGFGTFKVVTRKARLGRHPKTGEYIQIPEKEFVKFKPSAMLLEPEARQ